MTQRITTLHAGRYLPRGQVLLFVDIGEGEQLVGRYSSRQAAQLKARNIEKLGRV